MDRISLSDGARLFKLTYNAMWGRLHKSKYNYPHIYVDSKGAYLDKEECSTVYQKELEFFRNHISVDVASKLIFGKKHLIAYAIKKHRYSLTSVVEFYGNLYIPKVDFEKFYNDFCDRKRLIPFSYIRQKLGLPNTSKLYFFLQESNFYNVRCFSFIPSGRRYYNLNDANSYLKSIGLSKIIVP